MACPHDLDAEYLYPADARIAGIHERDGTVKFTIVLPCQECDEALEIDAPAATISETERPLVMDDADDVYD